MSNRYSRNVLGLMSTFLDAYAAAWLINWNRQLPRPAKFHFEIAHRCKATTWLVKARARRSPCCQHMVHHLAVSDVDKSEINQVGTMSDFQHVDMLRFLPAMPENCLPAPHEGWACQHKEPFWPHNLGWKHVGSYSLSVPFHSLWPWSQSGTSSSGRHRHFALARIVS